LVTGLGVVSCLGASVGEFWAAVCAGENGLGPLDRFDLEGCPYATAGLVRAPLPAFDGLSWAGRMAGAACAQALEGVPPQVRADTALVAATNFGPAERLERTVRDDLAELTTAPYHAETLRIARALELGGPAVTISLSCASGNAAAVHALDLIRTGRARAALACGYDAVERMSWAGLSALRVMAPAPDQGPPLVRPFDENRSGTIFSEGAGCLLLEEEACARRRHAEPLAVAAGGACNNNAYHMTHADEQGEGTALVLRDALRDAGLGPQAVDHVNAHGTGTRLNDVIETRALYAVLGERAGAVPVTSLKGGLGHAMGAAGALEAVASVLSVRDGLIPPTVNLQDRDPQCALDVVAGAARPARLRCVLSNAAGIGGSNAALVLGAWRQEGGAA
jgi:3-oxoacyl-(acyl-carrier-protein) synthase